MRKRVWKKRGSIFIILTMCAGMLAGNTFLTGEGSSGNVFAQRIEENQGTGSGEAGQDDGAQDSDVQEGSEQGDNAQDGGVQDGSEQEDDTQDSGVKDGGEEDDANRTQEEILVKDVLEELTYMRVRLGRRYLGREAEYDIYGERTIVQPNEGEKQIVIRDGDRAEIFYGTYRGVKEYEAYTELSDMLDAQFFLLPIANLELTDQMIKEQNYEMEFTETEQLEGFLTALSYVGAVDIEAVQLAAVRIRFDESYRPESVQFHLQSETIAEEDLRTVEQELQQQYAYDDVVEESSFEDRYNEILLKIQEIVPEEDVTAEQYIEDLSNVARAADESFLAILKEQSEELIKKDGWDRRAVFAYLEAIDARFGEFREDSLTEIPQETYLKELEDTFAEVHKVGSDVYTYMFEVSGLKAKEKALLVISQMGGYIDGNEMLQLAGDYQFDSEMPPHAEFLESYAACVRTAWQKKSGAYKILDNQKVHQFRMYIDRQNVQYVRSHFEGKTDYEKLKNYAKQYEFSLYYGEPSRHHNKILRKGRFEAQEYDKVLTPNRLSEFIIDVQTGAFITEWDILKVDEVTGIVSTPEAYPKQKTIEGKTIVDTESFNYAPANYQEAHQCLDVLPASPDKKKGSSVYLENQVKKAMKKVWKSPEKYQYRERYRSAKDYQKEGK
ncbi:MAG: DUF3114 domain-containing protein [Lachnospiraceae bacterium]|nr:DUF3114 domain-containing protein [Lachnospiraceae bacterium]